MAFINSSFRLKHSFKI